MKVLIDGDIVAFRCAFASEDEAEGIAIYRADTSIDKILLETMADDHSLYLSDSKESNYRYKHHPTYKANRTAPRPKHHAAIKQHLIEKHGAIIAVGEEADDALGIEQCNSVAGTTVIASIDKDMFCIPGKHFNFVKGTFREVGELESYHNFYEQLLVGDRADNIIGVDGIGKVKAPRHLSGCETPSDMFQVVQHLYNDDVRLLQNGIALWIRRVKNELWRFP